jgi:hypothetical protein
MAFFMVTTLIISNLTSPGSRWQQPLNKYVTGKEEGSWEAEEFGVAQFVDNEHRSGNVVTKSINNPWI